MKYIKRSSNGIMVKDKELVELQLGLKEYINTLCIRNLSTFKGREEAAGLILNRKSILPIYVNEDLLLVPTECIRNYECTYLNSNRILGLQFESKRKTKVIFDDLSELIVPITKDKLANQLLRSRHILETKMS